MRTWMYSLAFVGIGLFHYGADYWWSKWAVMLAALAVVAGARIARTWTLSAGAAFTWTTLSGIWISAWRDTYVATLDKLQATSFDAVTAASLAAFLLVAWAAAGLARDEFPAIRRAWAIACLAASVQVLGQAVVWRQTGSSTVGGFFDQDSMTGCFIAATLPFVLELPRWRELALIPVAAVIATGVAGASNPIGVAVVAGLAVFATRGRLVAAVAGAAVGLAAFAFVNPTLFSSSGRFELYRSVGSWFARQELRYWLHGLGNGTFFMFGPSLHPHRFLWLHSDWAQAAFELGVVGLALYLWLAWDCVRGARGDRHLLASLLGVAAAGVFQYPVHLSLFAVLAASLVALSLAGLPARSPRATVSRWIRTRPKKS